jgi:hypothetical protein
MDKPSAGPDWFIDATRAVMEETNTHSAAAGALLLARPRRRREWAVRLRAALKVPWPCEPCAAVRFHSGLCDESCATAIDDHGHER